MVENILNLMKKTIPYGRQNIDNQDIREVCNTLKSDFLTTGNKVIEFENKLKNFTKANYVATCNSGTSALYLSMLAIDLKKDDNVIIPAINFIASYNACKILNANVYLADVDPVTGQMTPETLIECIKINKIKKIKLIISMYLSGNALNVQKLYKIKKKYNCFLIEDACHALGSEYKEGIKKIKVGSCKHSDICTFSFHPIKSITTAEGGAITTNNKKIIDKILLLRSHGIVRSNKEKHWHYDVKTYGYNFRLSDFNCALGISQLKKINTFISFRKKVAKFYIQKLKKIKENLILPDMGKTANSWHLFLVSINFKKIKKNKELFFKFMKNNGVIVQYHYIPLYRFSITKNKYNKLKNAEIYFNNAVSMPIFYKFKKKQQLKVLTLLNNFLKKK